MAMSMEAAIERIQQQLSIGSGYSRHSIMMVLGEVSRAHGQQAVDFLIREFDLENLYGFVPGRNYDLFS